MSYKLEADCDTLGLLKMQCSYIYSLLGGAAQNMAVLFAERAL